MVYDSSREAETNVAALTDSKEEKKIILAAEQDAPSMQEFDLVNST